MRKTARSGQARGVPKHHAITEDLEAKIRSGDLAAGSCLKSEPQLAIDYGVAYMTIRRALTTLVEKGVLYRVRGRGTFVADANPADNRPSLGLLLLRNWHSIDPFYFPPMVSGFVERAEEQGYQVHLADRSQPLLEILRFHELHVRAVACVLLDLPDLEDADALLDQGVVVVAINHYGGLRRVTSVSPDNRKGSYNATRALLELGHREFVFLGGPKFNFDATERRRGFETAIKEAGDSVRRQSIIEAGFSEEAGYEQADKLLKKGKLPTAFVVASDLPAIGLMKRLREGGISIPKDVSVIGFGDFRLAGYVHPALTTVKLPLDEIGRKAADALIAQYKGGRAETLKLDCPIIWRETVGPAAR